MNMNTFYQTLPPEYRETIAQLEAFDEFEEFHLTCSHYTLLTASKGGCNAVNAGMWEHGIGSTRSRAGSGAHGRPYKPAVMCQYRA